MTSGETLRVQQRVQDAERGDAPGVAQRPVHADRPADVVDDDRDVVDAERGEEAVEHVLEEGEVVADVERLGRPAVAGQVDRHDAVGGGEVRHDVAPQQRRGRPAVHEQHRRAVPASR
jgi:hypothetical protein